MPRVTLTKAELETPQGQGLVSLIERIGADGEITLQELCELLSMVEKNGPFGDLASAVFLRGVIHDIIADGEIDVFEAERLRKGLARVLPAQIRDRFEEAMPQDPASERPTWYYDQATERQWDFLRKLGHRGTDMLNKGEASELISSLLESRNPATPSDETLPTPRQMMVIRFWARKELATASRSQVSDFLDSWYSGNPLRKTAWELWKAEQSKVITDPNEVPEGIGPEWLKKATDQIARDMDIVRRQSSSSVTKRRELTEPAKPKGFFARLFGSK